MLHTAFEELPRSPLTNLADHTTSRGRGEQAEEAEGAGEYSLILQSARHMSAFSDEPNAAEAHVRLDEGRHLTGQDAQGLLEPRDLGLPARLLLCVGHGLLLALWLQL